MSKCLMSPYIRPCDKPISQTHSHPTSSLPLLEIEICSRISHRRWRRPRRRWDFAVRRAGRNARHRRRKRLGQKRDEPGDSRPRCRSRRERFVGGPALFQGRDLLTMPQNAIGRHSRQSDRDDFSRPDDLAQSVSYHRPATNRSHSAAFATYARSRPDRHAIRNARTGWHSRPRAPA